MPARSVRFMLIACVLVGGLCLPSALSAPRVTRGGLLGGPGTVTVRTGSGVNAVWNVRTGTLAKVILQDDSGEIVLMTGVGDTTWFVGTGSSDSVPVRYNWRGYRFHGDTVVLLHELQVPGGPSLSVHEIPESVVGPGGLLSLQRTFTVSASTGEPVDHVSVVKRIRTGTLGGVTLPVSTNGRLVPPGSG